MKPEKFNISRFLIENRWVWHVSFWVFYGLYVAKNYYITVLHYPDYLNFMLVSDAFFVAFVYLTLFLYKQLVVRKHYLIFLSSGALLWVGFVVIRALLRKTMMQSIPSVANSDLDEFILSNLPGYFQFYIFVVIFKYLKDSFIQQYHLNQRQKLQLHFELENLKGQISPHFLFNTMNNFYGLAVENSKKLPDLMIRLSDLLRYSLYETKQEKVPLTNEINYLKNYIELEKIRLESNLNLAFNVAVKDPEKYQIAPLLFIVFIENAFKHARNMLHEPIFIAINLTVSEHGILTLHVKNNYNANAQHSFVTGKGIGLENVKKRLKVIYPDDTHSLTLQQDANFYQVALTIDLN